MCARTVAIDAPALWVRVMSKLEPRTSGGHPGHHRVTMPTPG